MAGCATVAAGASEESGLLVSSPEQKEAHVILECLCSGGEQICIELPLFRIEKFEVSGMSRI